MDIGQTCAISGSHWLGSICSFGSFLCWEQSWVDVRQYTALGDRDVAEQLAQLIILLDGELKVSWCDPVLVTGGVSRQFQDLRGNVFKSSSHEDSS